MPTMSLVSLCPTLPHLGEVQQWLKREHTMKQEGFYVNWKQINLAFAESRMAVISSDEQIVGFATCCTTLDVTGTHNSNQGISGWRSKCRNC